MLCWDAEQGWSLWAVPCATPCAGCCLGGGVWGLRLGCSNFPVALEWTGDRDVGSMPWGSWGQGCSAGCGGLHSRENQTRGREPTRSLTAV